MDSRNAEDGSGIRVMAKDVTVGNEVAPEPPDAMRSGGEEPTVS